MGVTELSGSKGGVSDEKKKIEDGGKVYSPLYHAFLCIDIS